MGNRDKYLLLTAGPAPISPVVQNILSQPMIYHRDEEFVQIFNQVTKNLKYLLQTEHEIFILTASGTGAMEATITNLFSPGETVLVVENGKFSERWSQIAEFFGLDVKRVQLQWGKSPALDQLAETIKGIRKLKAVFLTHCETSTGALTDLASIVPHIRKMTPSIIVVDAISSAGVLPLKMDQWGIDVITTASQKGLGLPPGLSFVALNKRLWQYVEQAELPRYYFDFTRARQSLRLSRGSAFTPAIPLIIAADVILNQFRKAGMETIWQQRKELAVTFRQKLNTLGLKIFPDNPADSIAVIDFSEQYKANDIISSLKKEYGIMVSKGQGRLSNRVIRIGHFANVDDEQLNQFLEAMESILSN